MSASVTVINTPPEVVSVSLDSNVIYTDDTITALANVIDIDGDPTLIYYTWYVDGMEVKTGLGSTLDGDDFNKDQEILVVAYANDGVDSSFSVASAPVTVLNSRAELISIGVH